jgi:hypothetical protein
MKRESPLRMIIPIVLCTLASLSAYAIAAFVFQFATLNADENSYLFQAHNFVDGRISRPAPPFESAFDHLMIIISPEVGWLSRYPPGHPLFLVPGVFLGDPYLVVALAAGLSLFAVYGSGVLLGGHTLGIVAALLLLFSPFFLFYHGTLVSHSSALLASSVMLVLYVRWKKNGEIWCAGLSGFAWGWLATNRTYTALLIAIPFAIDSLATLHEKRDRKTLLGTLSFAAASASGVIALLFYNHLAVGDPWLMTYLYYDPAGQLGFGKRSHTGYEHSLTKGLQILVTNLQVLNVWLWGFGGSLLLWLILALVGWTKEWSRFLIGAIVSLYLGYVYFWYQGARDAGPAYYFESLPFLVLSAAFGVQRILGKVRPWHVAVCAGILVSVDVLFMLEAAKETRANNVPRSAILDVLRDAPPASLVFIDPREHRDAFSQGNDMIFNPRGLEGDILVVRSTGEQDKIIRRFFREYTPFRLTGTRPPRLQSAEPDEPYHFVLQGHSMHRRTGTNLVLPSGETVRAAFEGDHPEGELAFGRYLYVSPASYEVTFELEVSDCMPARPTVTVDVAAGGGRRILSSKRLLLEDHGRIEISLPVSVNDFSQIEPRVHYHSCGTVFLRTVSIKEVAVG